MKDSKVLRGICYCLIPVLILIIGFSIFYEFSFNYFNDLGKISFMELAAPVIIPISTLILLIMIIFLIISIGHNKRKRRD